MNESTEITRTNETSMTPVTVSADQMGVIEARIRSEYQVRTMLAVARPRDIDEVRQRILKDCKRPGFAAVAEYGIPRGGTTIKGASIRFADAAAQHLGNLAIENNIVREDENERVCEVVVTDLERNATARQQFVVSKSAERRKLPPNVRQEDIISERVGADGQRLFVIKLGDNDVLMKQGSAEARVRRNLILRLLPGDIRDEALEACRATLRTSDAVDPDAAKKRLIDAFAEQRVKVADLKAYLGHDVDSCSPAELEDLRSIFAGIKSGDIVWSDVIAQAEKDAEKKADPSAKAAESVKARLSGAGDK